jgi:hypothetical protein
MNLRDVGSETSVNDSVQTNKMINNQQSSEQNNRKLISLHNNGEDEKHALLGEENSFGIRWYFY